MPRNVAVLLLLLPILHRHFAAALPSPAAVNYFNQLQLKLINGSMDTSADPCDDFYNYACGNWPSYQGFSENYIDTMSLLEYNFEKTLDDILSTALTNEIEKGKRNQSITDKVLIYYYSCKNTETEAFHGYFWEIQPGMPMEWPLLQELRAYQQGIHSTAALNTQSFTKFDIWALLGQLHSYGFNDILLHLKLPKVISAYGVCGLAAPESAALNPSIIDAFFKFSQLPLPLQQKYRHAIQRTDYSWNRIYETFSLSQEMETISFGQLKRTYPYLGKYFDLVLPNETMDEQTMISLNMDYINFLYHKTWQPEEIRKLCHYVMVKIFERLRENGPKTCGEALRKRLPMAVDYLYLKRVLEPQAQNITAEMAELKKNLNHHFISILRENKLKFTYDQMQAIKHKLSELQINIGNIPADISKTFVEEFFKHIPNLDINNFYKNDLLLRRQQVLTSLTCPEGFSCSSKINLLPLYVEEDNVVVVPMTSLSPPLYHPTFEKVFSLSLLGTLIARELVRVVDYKTLTEHPTFKEFHQDFQENRKIQMTFNCLQSQESEDDINDRLIDLVGSQVAFRTYKQEYAGTVNYISRPMHQLYFLNLAQFFCGRPDGINVVDHDSHETRLQDMTMNMPEFAEAFNCPAGSRMNPEWKCRFY